MYSYIGDKLIAESVTIFTECGREYGYGHLMRCLAIAQGFKVAGIDSVFYIRGDAEPENILNEFKWSCLEWLENTPDVKDRIVIVDSYHADEAFCTKLYNKAGKVLFIDDYNRIPYPGGFVLNSVIGAKEIGYSKNNKITYLLGPKYHPLRREFWDVPEKVINRKVKKILITFGGSDMTNETPGVLRFLHENYTELEKHVIIGKGFSNIEKIKNNADDKTVLIMHPDAEVMKSEMLECDVGISAAGQTIYELARVGIFTYAVKVAENQDKNLTRWMETGFLSLFDTSIIFPEKKYREGSCSIGREIIDGQGVHRIVDVLAND